MNAAGPASPCINICTLDAEGFCLGCCRSLKEIAGWSRMTAAEQWGVIERADARRAQQDAARSAARAAAR